jgi:hypothetical protein
MKTEKMCFNMCYLPLRHTLCPMQGPESVATYFMELSITPNFVSQVCKKSILEKLSKRFGVLFPSNQIMTNNKETLKKHTKTLNTNNEKLDRIEG